MHLWTLISRLNGRNICGVNTTGNRSWLGRLIVAVLVALIGAGAIGLMSLQIQFGNITIIIGDKNKVENGSQTQTVIQPTKPQTVEAKPQQAPSQPTALATPVEQPSAVQNTPSQVSNRRRTRPIQYESDEDCTCPDDEEAVESEPEPVVQQTYNTVYVPTPRRRVIVVPSYSQYQTQTISNDGYSQYQTQSSTSTVYVQSNGVTVRTSTNGANARTRVVVNGRVVVDQ